MKKQIKMPFMKSRSQSVRLHTKTQTEHCLSVNNEVKTGAARKELYKLIEKPQQSNEEECDEENKEEEEEEAEEEEEEKLPQNDFWNAN